MSNGLVCPVTFFKMKSLKMNIPKDGRHVTFRAYLGSPPWNLADLKMKVSLAVHCHMLGRTCYSLKSVDLVKMCF